MKAKRKLSETLKEAMQKEALDLISVKSLTDKTKMNRQTFYYHFRNIYDLLTWTFLNEDINIDGVKSYAEGLKVIYDYVQNNEALISNVLNSAAKDLVSELLFNKFYNLNLMALKAKTDFEEESTKFYARLYGAGFASTLIDAIINEIDSENIKAKQTSEMHRFISLHTNKEVNNG